MRNFLFLFTVLAVVSSSLGQTDADRSGPLKYQEFIEKLQAGQVRSVSLGPFARIEGTYLQGEAEVSFFTEHALAAANDPLLSELLEQKGISVTRTPEPQVDAAAKILQSLPFIILLFVPAILLVFVLIYVVRINNKIDQVVIR